MSDESPDNNCLVVLMFVLIVSLIIALAALGSLIMLLPES